MENVKLNVSILSTFDEDQDFDDPRFLKVRIATMHTGKNLNNSSFSKKVVQDAKDTFKNIAILADVVSYVDDDGNQVLDYAGHTMGVEEDKLNPGEYRTIYKEKVVGIIPESNDWSLQYDKENDWYIPVVTGYIYKQYGNYVADILKARGGKTDVSAEIYCPDISIDANDGTIIVNKMIMSGVTLLGEGVVPAMKNASASVFSIDADDKQTQLTKLITELTQALNQYTALHDNATNSQKGGVSKQMKLEELKKKFNVTDEDIDFETEGLSDEELEAKFTEKFGGADTAPADPEPSDSESSDPEPTDPEPDEPADPEPSDPEPTEPEPEKNTVKYSVNGKEFSVSLTDIQYALEDLVNETYADSDNDYYYCDVYLDDKTIVMHSLYTGKSYRQSFKSRSDQYSLVGDRIEVKAVYVTADEEKALNDMKSNYSSISEELNKYHEEPKKAEILNSDVYSALADNDDYKNLVENHFDMSVDDVQKKADEILLNSVKQHKFSYNNNDGTDEKKNFGVKPLPKSKKSKRNFGSLFDGII